MKNILGLTAIYLFVSFTNSIAQTPLETFTIADEFTLDSHADNGADFANSIVSYKGAIYYGYIDGALNGCIAKKDMNGSITSVVVRPGMTLDNHHFEISIAIDAEGYIHWAGDMHQSNIVYYRSNKPEDITAFNALNYDHENGGMYGMNNHGVSYGRYITSRKGTLFYVSRVRLGAVADGWVPGGQGGHIQVYNTDTKRWSQLGSLNYSFLSDKGLTITGGMDAQHQIKAVFWDNSGAGTPPSNGYQGYKIRIVFDKNNRMHMVWNVAKNPVHTSVANTHTHLLYAYSDDEGITWKKSDASSLALPITTDNGEVVYTEDPNVNAPRMGNFCNITLTNDNRPILLQQSLSQNKVLVFRHNGFGWTDVSDTWVPVWFSEAIADGNGWLTLIAGGSTIRRSNDNGLTFRNYSPFPISYQAGLMSFDDQYLYESGILRYQYVTGNSSSVKTINWQNSSPSQVPLPSITPLSGSTFTTSATVTMNCEDWNATIRYTTDGSVPTEANGTIYTSPFMISATTTIKAIAYRPGLVTSRMVASRISKFVLDNQPPTAPSNLSASAIGDRRFTLNWDASIDNTGVTGYEVYRNGVLAGSTSGARSLLISNLTPLTGYNMTVRAFDAQANYSPLSSTLLVTTISGEASIMQTPVAPVIDGVREALWNNAYQYSLDINNAGIVNGVPDLSVTWTSLYDADFIYFFIDVNDNIINTSAGTWYENDGVEIYIDATNRKGPTYQATDFQFNYLYGNAGLVERSRNASTAGTQLVKLDKEGGYRVEVKIPWVVLGMVSPALGQKIGIDVMTIDNDIGAWKGKLAWYNIADNSWNNPAAFGTAIFTNTLLPLRLLSFKGRRQVDGIFLHWLSTSERNVKGFEVERSLDSEHFVAVGEFVRAGTNTYSFLDEHTVKGNTYYYRLKVVDIDGTFERSQIITIKAASYSMAIFDIYPNPVKSILSVRNNSYPEVDEFNIDVIDLAGKVLIRSIAKSSLTNINLANLVPGYYLVVLNANGKIIHQQKIIKN